MKNKTNVLIKYENLSNSRYFKEKNVARKFVIFFFILSIFIIILLEFLIFISLFYNIKNIGIDKAVYFNLISLTLLIILYVDFLSIFTQSIYSFLVREKEAFWLSLPISARDVLDFKFIKTYIVSTMFIIIFSIPLIFSYLYIFSFSYVYYFFVILSLFVFSFLVVNLVFLITSLINIIFKKFNLYRIFVFFYIIAVLSGIIFIIHYLPNLGALFKSHSIKSFEDIFISTTQPSFSPQYILSNIILNINSFYNFLILLLESLFLFVVYIYLSKFSELRILRGQNKSFWKVSLPKYFIFSKDLNKFINEEIKIFNSGIIIFVFILILIILFSISKFNLLGYEKFIFSAFCITFGYLITLFGLYFVFPSFSQEGRSGWIIFSSPLNRKSIFSQKTWASVTFILLHALIISILFSLILRFNLVYTLYFYNFVLFISLGLAILFSSLGIAYPNFAKRDIQDLSTTPSGLVSTLIAIFYIFFPIYIFYNFGMIASLIFLYIVFIFIMVFCFKIAYSKIQNMDFSIRN